MPLGTLSIGGTQAEGLSGQGSQSIFSTVRQHFISYYYHHHLLLLFVAKSNNSYVVFSNVAVLTIVCSNIVCGHIASYAFNSKLLTYCVRSIMLLRMISLASGETSYCSKIISGSLISSFRNSGSLAALRRTSLIISASFCWDSKGISTKLNARI